MNDGYWLATVDLRTGAVIWGRSLPPCHCRLRGEQARAAMAKVAEYAKPKEAA